MRKVIALLLSALLFAGSLAGCVIENKTPHVPTGNGLDSQDATIPVVTKAPEEEEETTPIVMAYYAELGMNPQEELLRIEDEAQQAAEEEVPVEEEPAEPEEE